MFENVKMFWAPVPIYPLAIWSFILCSKSKIPEKPLRKLSGEFYSKDLHKLLFTLPPFISKLIKS